jgi:hypothetical protein
LVTQPRPGISPFQQSLKDIQTKKPGHPGFSHLQDEDFSIVRLNISVVRRKPCQSMAEQQQDADEPDQAADEEALPIAAPATKAKARKNTFFLFRKAQLEKHIHKELPTNESKEQGKGRQGKVNPTDSHDIPLLV